VAEGLINEQEGQINRRGWIFSFYLTECTEAVEVDVAANMFGESSNSLVLLLAEQEGIVVEEAESISVG
jgi:hypothetical protein